MKMKKGKKKRFSRKGTLIFDGDFFFSNKRKTRKKMKLNGKKK